MYEQHCFVKIQVVQGQNACQCHKGLHAVCIYFDILYCGKMGEPLKRRWRKACTHLAKL
jgi:hypothetical protein